MEALVSALMEILANAKTQRRKEALIPFCDFAPLRLCVGPETDSPGSDSEIDTRHALLTHEAPRPGGVECRH